MWRSESLVRILSEVAYASCVIAFLSFFYNGSPFCGRLQVLKLALVVVALDILASSFGWAFSWNPSFKAEGGRLCSGIYNSAGFGMFGLPPLLAL